LLIGLFPNETKNKDNDVEWKKMARLRDIIIHEYFGVDLGIIWPIIKNKPQRYQRNKPENTLKLL